VVTAKAWSKWIEPIGSFPPNKADPHAPKRLEASTQPDKLLRLCQFIQILYENTQIRSSSR
jgi:hypothetical protein